MRFIIRQVCRLETTLGRFSLLEETLHISLHACYAHWAWQSQVHPRVFHGVCFHGVAVTRHSCWCTLHAGLKLTSRFRVWLCGPNLTANIMDWIQVSTSLMFRIIVSESTLSDYTPEVSQNPEKGDIIVDTNETHRIIKENNDDLCSI